MGSSGNAHRVRLELGAWRCGWAALEAVARSVVSCLGAARGTGADPKRTAWVRCNDLGTISARSRHDLGTISAYLGRVRLVQQSLEEPHARQEYLRGDAFGTVGNGVASRARAVPHAWLPEHAWRERRGRRGSTILALHRLQRLQTVTPSWAKGLHHPVVD